MEILSLRLAENKPQEECLYGLLPCILDQCFPAGEQNKATIVGKIKKVIEEWRDLLKSFIHCAADEDLVMELIEEYCRSTPFVQSCFHLILPPFNNEELLNDEAIFRWKEKAEAESANNKVLTEMLKQVFV